MSTYSHSQPADVDPRAIQADENPLADHPTSGAGAHAEAGGPSFRRMKCYNLRTKEFAGYLSNRYSNSTAIGTGDDYPPELCYWWESGGARYLSSQSGRCLGVSDSWYACWALRQARNMGYFTNVIHNPDGTISPGTYPELYLAGPYRKYGIDWTWWAPKGHSDILVCELEIASAPTWQNWSGNLKHVPALDGGNYYYTPKNLVELKTVLEDAREKGNVTIRVSGQRHSQPPLVADDNRNAPPKTSATFLVDMSCYVDVGAEGIELGPNNLQVTVNPGVREDALDSFLTRNNLMLKTVTAGGFFSIGGMTAVDVHGGTVEGPIFAETASSFTVLGADGNLTTIDARSPAVSGWSPLQFARVSLGGLGIVTRITLDVLPRPYATTLRGGAKRLLCKDRNAFVSTFKELLTGPLKHDRMEVFYSPYAAAPNLPFPPQNNFLVLSWDVVDDPEPKTPNGSVDPKSACGLAGAGEFGAPLIGGLKGYGVKYVRDSQYYDSPYNPVHFQPVPTAGFAAIALDEIETQAAAANANYSDLWLAESAQVMFMSYFVELPDLDDAGLSKVWDGLAVVAERVIQNGNFHIAAPMEFRFVKSGNSAMSGSYSTKSSYFVNLDLIGWVDPTTAAEYPSKMLAFFADIERAWVAMGGLPHNGKMYGFYDPSQPAGTWTAPFNSNFLAMLRERRGAPLAAFKAFRDSVDPTGRFYNSFLRQLLGG